MKELIEYMPKALSDKPEGVSVREMWGKRSSMIELRVAKDHLGKVIGRRGRSTSAPRTILSAASTKMKMRSRLEVLEEAASQRAKRHMVSACRIHDSRRW
jgi:predicted RNA-binding protein YlqC (UPF0109 family)